MIDDHTLSHQFRALAHPSRALIFRTLLETPEAGESVASLRAAVGLSDSALSHHLREMAEAGVIHQKRHGPCTATFLTPDNLVAMLAHFSFAVETKAYQLDAA